MVRLAASDGSVGWGEAVTLQEEAARATAVVLAAWAPLVIGAPASPAGVACAVESRLWWYGAGGGLSGFAVAALDISARIRWSVPEAVHRVRAFADHGLHWIEGAAGRRRPGGVPPVA